MFLSIGGGPLGLGFFFYFVLFLCSYCSCNSKLFSSDFDNLSACTWIILSAVSLVHIHESFLFWASVHSLWSVVFTYRKDSIQCLFGEEINKRLILDS